MGKSIWFPGGYELYPDETMCLIVTHEVVHLAQKKKLGLVGFYLRYLAPQIFIIPLVFLTMSFLVFWAAILIPWPSPWRARLEEEAYVTESWLAYQLGRDSSPWKEHLIDALSSNVYWGMVSDTRAWAFANETVIDIWVRGDFDKAEPTVLGFAKRAFREWQNQKPEGGGETK